MYFDYQNKDSSVWCMYPCDLKKTDTRRSALLLVSRYNEMLGGYHCEPVLEVSQKRLDDLYIVFFQRAEFWILKTSNKIEKPINKTVFDMNSNETLVSVLNLMLLTLTVSLNHVQASDYEVTLNYCKKTCHLRNCIYSIHRCFQRNKC